MILTPNMRLKDLRVTHAETGDPVAAATVLERFSWLIEQVRVLGQGIVDDHWRPADLALVASGRRADGTKLTGPGAERCRQLGWLISRTAQLSPCSRTEKMAQAGAWTLLQQAARRNAILAALLGNLDANLQVDWPAFWKATPAGTDRREAVSLLRRLTKYVDEHGTLPAHLVDIATPPRMPEKAGLGAVDPQMAVVDQQRARAGWFSLRCRIPTTEFTTKRTHYEWWRIEAPIPAYFRAQHPGALRKLCLPSVRIREGAVIFDVGAEVEVPGTPADAPTKALGIDWGLNSFLTAALVARQTDGNIATDGVCHAYDDGGLIAKSLRLQQEQEFLRKKIDALSSLAMKNEDAAERVRLERKANSLADMRNRVNQKRQHLTREIAFDAANWVVSLALEANTSAIYVEDLHSLEAGKLGKKNNRWLSASPRGDFCDALVHEAAKAGLRVHPVPAQGTSKLCPSCDHELARPEYSVGVCRCCRISAHRDLLAAEKIAQRGVSTHTAKRRHGRPVRQVVFEPVRKTRDKLGPTPRQHTRRHRSGRPAVDTHRICKPVTFAYPGHVQGRPGRVCSGSPQGVTDLSRRLVSLSAQPDSS